jgi:lysophospholipase L1-like esterase
MIFFSFSFGSKTKAYTAQEINPNMNAHFSMLCLGDSYTIGEKVTPGKRFPNQTIDLLREKNIFFDPPKIIATTGWTTDELMNAISKEALVDTYDIVTLLIGVNNQYRGRSLQEYRQQFNALLDLAIRFAGNKPSHVIVLSIPDWGVTPFAADRNRKKISDEISQFNTANKDESDLRQVHYIDITPVSRKAESDLSLLAEDGLHPSGKMYAAWANQLAPVIESEIKNIAAK